MEIFVFGMAAGMIALTLVIMISAIIKLIYKKVEIEKEEESDVDMLLEGLYTMKAATGLCREEKRLISAAIAYIEKTKGE